MAVDVIEQNLDGSDLSIGVVVSRFNEYAGKELYAACLEELKRLGVAEEDITYVTVPGALGCRVWRKPATTMLLSPWAP